MAIKTTSFEREIPLPDGVGGEYILITPDYTDSNLGGLTCRDKVHRIELNLVNSTIKVIVTKYIDKLDGSTIEEDLTYELQDTPGVEKVETTYDPNVVDENGDTIFSDPVVTTVTPVYTPVQEWIDSTIWPAITSSIINRIIAAR